MSNELLPVPESPTIIILFVISWTFSPFWSYAILYITMKYYQNHVLYEQPYSIMLNKIKLDFLNVGSGDTFTNWYISIDFYLINL